MDFTITSSNKRGLRQRGFTIVELMIALLIGVMLVLGVIGLTMSSGKSLAGLFNYADLQYNSRRALDTLSRDIRQSAFLQSISSNRLALVDYDGEQLVFEHTPTDGTLVRTKGTEKTVLLRGCEWLNFAIYQRSPVSGTLDSTPSVNPASAKVIDVSWNCSRTILGAKVTTEPVQGAKIVIRK